MHRLTPIARPADTKMEMPSTRCLVRNWSVCIRKSCAHQWSHFYTICFLKKYVIISSHDEVIECKENLSDGPLVRAGLNFSNKTKYRSNHKCVRNVHSCCSPNQTQPNVMWISLHAKQLLKDLLLYSREGGFYNVIPQIWKSRKLKTSKATTRGCPAGWLRGAEGWCFFREQF